MSNSLTVVIIDSDADSLGNIQNFIKNIDSGVALDGVATSYEAGYELVHKKRPAVVIMELGADVDKGIEQISTMLSRFPQLSVFVTSEDKSSDTILKAMRAGAAEYLLRPVTETDLTVALQKMGRLWVKKVDKPQEFGKIISIFSPKGGVGVTTMAINLAASIYETTKQSTLLVDLDLNAGDVSIFLNMRPSYTISDVTVNMNRLDQSFLTGVISRHDSGIHVLAEPTSVTDAISISGVEIKKVLGLLRSMFSYIIIDLESTIDERTMASIEMSDMVLLAFVLSLPGINSARKYLDFFSQKGFDKSRIKLVVNRYLKRSDIKISDAESILNQGVFVSIPNDYEASMACLNKGIPMNMYDPRSPVNKAMSDLARNIIGHKR